MPGPQDHSDQAVGGYERGQDEGRRPDPREGQPDRPLRGSVTDLRQRLESLPPGHPSSPYHDDGSRKSPVIRLKDLELPVRSDVEPNEAEGPDAGRPDADRPDADRPDADRPDADRPDADRPDADRPDADRPDADRPDADRPDADRPDADRPDADRTQKSVPEIGKEAPGRLEAISAVDSDQPRSGRDGSWEWKGRRLTPDQSRIADQTLSRCRAAEGRTVFGTYGDVGLTPSMRRIEAQLEHGQLVPDTEKFALKSPDRFKEKLAGLIADEPGAKPTDLAADIPDAVRYTYLFAEDHYSEAILRAHDSLEDQGFELQTRRNSWENQEYKGVNSRWLDQASGQLFEVQFHTEQSWAAKQQTHQAYEGIAAATTSVSERERLRVYQRKVSSSVPIPPGALDIPNYRKDD